MFKMQCILSSCGLNVYSWSASFAASCDESCDFKNATCANFLKNKDFVLIMANIRHRNEVSSICALKPAQDSSIQLYLRITSIKLARKRRNLRSWGSVLYFSIKIQSITKNDACFLLFSVFPLLNYSKISER
jgi:hypothetical protein